MIEYWIPNIFGFWKWSNTEYRIVLFGCYYLNSSNSIWIVYFKAWFCFKIFMFFQAKFGFLFVDKWPLQEKHVKNKWNFELIPQTYCNNQVLTIRLFDANYSNSRILFRSWKSNEYEYRIPLFSPNYSNTRIIRIIRENTAPSPWSGLSIGKEFRTIGPLGSKLWLFKEGQRQICLKSEVFVTLFVNPFSNGHNSGPECNFSKI